MPLQTIQSLRASGASGAYFRPGVLRRLAVFLAIGLPLVWGFVVYQRLQLTDTAREDSQRNVQNLAHAFAEEVRSSMVTIDLSLSQLRLSWLRNPEHFADIAGELNSHLHGTLAINLAVTDARGRVVFSNIAGAPAQVDLGDRDHVRAHLGYPGDAPPDRLYIGTPVKGRLSGRWTVQFSRPILDRDGKLAGVIIAGVAPDYFSRFYSNIKIGADASIALVRVGGVVIARTTHDLTMRDSGKVLTGFPYMPGSGSYGTFQRVSRLDGVDRHYGWRRLSDYGLVVTVGQSVREADAQYARQQDSLLYTGIGVSPVLALAGWAAVAASDNRQRGIASLAAAEARWQLALNAAAGGASGTTVFPAAW
ncbi:cache domain-containing protein [Massilia sp. Se16.2.3]|uniref:cache domain-containing protein n=1 Tax=Massilia sp. Se16.2.3 TaxID=2709303 RepID=UPI00160446B3|nr:cache domain-containing protein [Massilia sp. Se16.2.3]QNB01234.1 hypothetical protein G4G31_24460 [Massilia sp. Se16.2.3]